MCWPRAWSQILLPVFLSLALIQLFISFSDHKFTKTHRNWNRRSEQIERECAEKQTCPLCTKDRRCIWCREERLCKKYCFPYSDCKFNSMFWANCRVDLFGIMMLILVALLAIGFLWYCLAYYLYMEEKEGFSSAAFRFLSGIFLLGFYWDFNDVYKLFENE
ncbi:hypothetical protein H671_1g3127 [Cricetulus griseus]|uniref:Uncharacterized protein n=1 Tax=Cricetulus griseus TaxID=10029 RepID=A0A061IHH5_CRIGR|nr:hypothetical protein H671_1g3127 [Cricetulus griseus]